MRFRNTIFKSAIKCLTKQQLQNVGNGTNKWPGPLKEPHKTISEEKEAHIKVNISVSPLVISNNRRKKAEAIEALLKSVTRTVVKSSTNTKSITKVSTKESNQQKARVTHKLKHKSNYKIQKYIRNTTWKQQKDQKIVATVGERRLANTGRRMT